MDALLFWSFSHFFFNANTDRMDGSTVDLGGAGGLAIRQCPSTPLCHLEALSLPYPKDLVVCATATFSRPKHKLMNHISQVTLFLCSFSVYLLKLQRAHVRGELHLGAASHICFHLWFISKRTHSQKHTVNPLFQKETMERLMGSGRATVSFLISHSHQS